jgi:hypothetical protein
VLLNFGEILDFDIRICFGFREFGFRIWAPRFAPMKKPVQSLFCLNSTRIRGRFQTMGKIVRFSLEGAEDRMVRGRKYRRFLDKRQGVCITCAVEKSVLPIQPDSRFPAFPVARISNPSYAPAQDESRELGPFGAEESDMKRLAYASLLSLGLWMLTAGPALAQFGSYSRPQVNPYPTMSPYMNLLNGTNPATTFYGIVRPQIQARQSLLSLQQQFQTFENSTYSMLGTSGYAMFGQGQGQGQGPNQPLTTGHPVVFGNYGIYFPMMGGTGATGAANNASFRPAGRR